MREQGSNQFSQQQGLFLFDLLLQIDFQTQFDLVKTAIDEHKTLGFLIHGKSEHGQQILVNKLYRIKPNWKRNKPISIDVSSNGIYTDTKKI